MDNERRDNKIDAIRGFGMILVICGHALDLLLEKEILETLIWRRVYDAIYSFHMPLFFCMSGYLFKDKSNEKVKSILCKNIVSLYFPYLILNYLYWFERIVAKEILGMQLVSDTVSFSLKECIRLAYAGDGLTWFLLSLLLIKIIFSIVYRFSSYTICGVFFSIMLWTSYFFPQYRIFELLGWGYFFFIGYLFRKQIENIDKDKRKNLYILNVNFLVAGIIRYLELDLDIIVKMMIGIAVFIFCMLYLKYIPCFRVMQYCGKYSLVVYMVHGLSQYISFFCWVDIMGIENGVLVLLLMIVLQTTLSFFIVVCFTKIKWLKWLEIFFYPYKYLKKLVS